MKIKGLVTLRERLGALGPYLLIELLLPGGSLVAGLLWLSQRLRRAGEARLPATAPCAKPAAEASTAPDGPPLPAAAAGAAAAVA
jgi:hypothetical protein